MNSNLDCFKVMFSGKIENCSKVFYSFNDFLQDLEAIKNDNYDKVKVGINSVRTVDDKNLKTLESVVLFNWKEVDVKEKYLILGKFGEIFETNKEKYKKNCITTKMVKI